MAVCAQIGSLRKVLAQEPVRVFVGATLPRTARNTGVAGKIGVHPQLGMLSHLGALVPRE